MPERDLDILLRHMAPHLHPQTYVYCCVADGHVPPGLEPICTFREDEGLTLIVEKEHAEHAGLPSTFESRRITLTVNSALEAVGFLAAVSARLGRPASPATPWPATTMTTCSCLRHAPRRRWRCWPRRLPAL